MLSFPFLLPHEVFAKMLANDDAAQASLRVLAPEMATMRDKLCSDLGIDPAEFIPIGMHGDGVPHAKKKSLECFSWNFVAEPTAERFLTTCVDKTFCCKCGCSGKHTTEAILQVLCWSFRCMLMGKYPRGRHDGSPWRTSDEARKELKGSLGSRGGAPVFLYNVFLG